MAAREIGQRIAQARKEAGGMTQEQLADLVNVSQRSIQDYEAGVTIPFKHMREIASAVDRPMEWLLYGSASPEEESAESARLGSEVRALGAAVAEVDRKIDELLAALQDREANP